MFSLLVILFFAATGLTLNHPEWTFGFQETRQQFRGTMPAGWRREKGTDWLTVADLLRAKYGVHGTVTDRRDDSHESSISFKGPGYSADCFIHPETAAFELSVQREGPIGVLNDLHRGHDVGSIWSRLLDCAAIFLIVIALTGLALLFYLKRMRLTGLATVIGGCILLLVLMRMSSQ